MFEFVLANPIPIDTDRTATLLRVNQWQVDDDVLSLRCTWLPDNEPENITVRFVGEPTQQRIQQMLINYFDNGRVFNGVVTFGNPDADWDGFNAAILTNVPFNQYYGLGLQTAPAMTSSLPTALAQVSTNGVAAFSLVFGGFCQVVSATSQHRGEWADMATSFNLPSDFVAVVRG